MNAFQLMIPGDAHLHFGLVAAVVLIILGAVAGWVYLDAKERAQRGSPVVYSMDSFELRTPLGWFLCCLLLTELFVPLYIDSRSMA